MNLLKLEHFVTVCEYQNISKAAEALYISQPALSMSIAAVEKYFGHPLFERKNKKIYLNKEGEVALKYARDILERLDTMQKAIDECALSDRMLRLSSDDMSLCSLLSAKFLDDKPDFEIRNVPLKADIRDDREALLQGDTDLLLHTADLSGDRQLESDFMFEDHSYVLVPADSPFYGKKEADLREFEGLPFIRNKDLLGNQPFHLAGQRQKEFIAKENIRLKITYMDYAVIPALWTASRHYFFLTHASFSLNPVCKTLDQNRIIKLTNPELQYGYWLTYLKDAPAPAREFISWYRDSRQAFDSALPEAS